MSNDKGKFKLSETIEIVDSSSEENMEEDWDDSQYFFSCVDDIMGTNTVRDYLCEGEDKKIYVGPFEPDYVAGRMEYAKWDFPGKDITEYF